MKRVACRESPERLRECLEALAKHSGAHVLRVELTIKKDGSAHVIATHSSGKDAELAVAKLVCNTVQAILEPQATAGGA